MQEVKIFLTASTSVRAMRRYRELQEKGMMCNLEEIEQDIIERDARDMNRETAPLKQAEDAMLLDSSDMTLEQVVQAILEAAFSRGLAPGSQKASDHADSEARTDKGGSLMEVIVAKTAGFCFGVKRAVEQVYEQIEKAERRFLLWTHYSQRAGSGGSGAKGRPGN